MFVKGDDNMKKKSLQILLTGLFAIILLSGCGSSSNTEDTSQGSETKQQTEAPAGDVQEVTITATNWEFDQKVYDVKAGQPVKLNLVNDSGYHTLKVQGVNVDVTTDKPAVFTLEPGEYEIICNIQCGAGHMDMKAKLVVN